MGVAELKSNISVKSRSFRPTCTHKSQWPISDVSSDVTIQVGEASFALHKFPLVSTSGRFRKLLLDAKDSNMSRLNLSALPGGSEAFELAAKFCYGVNIEITITNVAMLRCAACFLEMTEEITHKNLETRTELFLKDTVFPSISNSVSVLHSCEKIVPVSEEVNLVSRLINAIANNASKEQLTSGLLKLEHNFPSKPIDIETRWGKSLILLNLELFQRVLSAFKTKGLKQDIISRILINYAHNSLHLVKGSLLDLDLQKKQRVTVETIVGLLPTASRKSTVPMAFLSSLLKSAIVASASTSDLERRIALQLHQGILEDLLIPGNQNGNSYTSLYETDSILRIFSLFLNLDEDDAQLQDENEMFYDFDSKQSSILKVSKLLDNYLAEIALDSNLTPSKFTALAELLPDHARLVDDGLYRAVDIFLKVHPNIKESERYRLCKSIDWEKLSEEGCRHAAQNERLPVQMAVQVVYFEQMRLRNAMNGGQNHYMSINGSGRLSPRDNYASVRRENRELKLEVARMRMRLTDLEQDHVSMKEGLLKSSSHPANKLFKSFTKILNKLNAMFHIKHHSKATSESPFPNFHTKRNHSVS